MIINPVTITMPRHELEALIAAASARHKALKGDTPTRRVLEHAIDNATYLLAVATGQKEA